MNKKGVLVAAGALVVIGSVGVVTLWQSNTTPSIKPVPATTQEALKKPTFGDVQQTVAAGGQLIDVRTVEEYNDRHIEGATNLPLQDIQQGIAPSVSKDKQLYLYCRSGKRATEAKQLLASVGYHNVINLGGIDDVVTIGGKTI